MCLQIRCVPSLKELAVRGKNPWERMFQELFWIWEGGTLEEDEKTSPVVPGMLSLLG